MSRIKGFETIARRGAFSVVKKLFIRRTAFTLAEVLIVLGIIGLVADMTIPTLHQNITEKVAVTRLKKSYSTLSAALQMAVAENGTVDNWFDENNSLKENSLILYNYMKPYLKIMKECETQPGCWTKGYLRGLTGLNYMDYDNNPNEPRIQLADGTALMFYVENPTCSPSEIYGAGCGNIKVDIDGFKGTYQWGRDVFVFNIYSNKIIPQGDSNDIQSFENFCDITKMDRDNGASCTAWVIYNENMDYLHCNDLSWDGKHSCK